MDDRVNDLRNDFNLHQDTKMLLFISIATNDMVKYVSMYPEVWFLDCTYGENLYKLSNHICEFVSHLNCIIMKSYITHHTF